MGANKVQNCLKPEGCYRYTTEKQKGANTVQKFIALTTFWFSTNENVGRTANWRMFDFARKHDSEMFKRLKIPNFFDRKNNCHKSIQLFKFFDSDESGIFFFT